ncbi:MAG TPA: hypothetical protein VGX24_09215 [Pyrinomonadaceae bacterium]|jgi:hypothetical protein|nr:hypothetical protein [Pyrinomonadaceae bacterium]
MNERQREMRRQTCLFFVIAAAILLGGCVQAHGQTVDRNQPFRTPDRRYELRSIVWKLRTVRQVSSRTPGWSPPGEFFKLSVELLRYGNEAEFQKLLKDENPILRVMGLVCLAQLDFEKHSQTLREHAIDKAIVALADQCTIADLTVGRIAGMLLKNPDFLGHQNTIARARKTTRN